MQKIQNAFKAGWDLKRIWIEIALDPDNDDNVILSRGKSIGPGGLVRSAGLCLVLLRPPVSNCMWTAWTCTDGRFAEMEMGATCGYRMTLDSSSGL